jgi:antitoxin HicB
MEEGLVRYEYEFTVLEQDKDGVYIAACPALRGCRTEGDTEEEAREMIKDAIALYIEHLRERGEPIPQDVLVTKVRVTA